MRQRKHGLVKLPEKLSVHGETGSIGGRASGNCKWLTWGVDLPDQQGCTRVMER